MSMSVKTWYPALDERNGNYQLLKAEMKAREKYSLEMQRIQDIRQLQYRCQGRYPFPETASSLSFHPRPKFQQAGARPFSRGSDASFSSQGLRHPNMNQRSGAQTPQGKLDMNNQNQGQMNKNQGMNNQNQGQMNKNQGMNNQNQGQMNKNQGMNNQNQGQLNNNQGMKNQQGQNQMNNNQGMKNQQQGQMNSNNNQGMNNQQQGQMNKNQGMNNQNQGQMNKNQGMNNQQDQMNNNPGMNNQQPGQMNNNQGMNNQQGQMNKNQGMNNQQQGQNYQNQGMNNQHQNQGNLNNAQRNQNQMRTIENQGTFPRSTSVVNNERRNSTFGSASRVPGMISHEAYPGLYSEFSKSLEFGIGSGTPGYLTPRSYRSSTPYSESPHFRHRSRSVTSHYTT